MTESSARGEVLVVTGVGGMGEACARRLGSAYAVVLADLNDGLLGTVADGMRRDGYDVHAVRTDVSSPDDVGALGKVVADLGALRCLVHTAGVSPVQATSEQIIAVDFIGTARMLDAFEPQVRPGTVAVCIASMAGTMGSLPPETLRLLASTPTDELHGLDVLDPTKMEYGMAYVVAKRGVQVRVEAAAAAWGKRGGRVVSISPGIISTAQGVEELAGPSGDAMRGMIEMSALGRIGTPSDIACAVEFLVSPAASFITGTDLLVDGGVVAAVRQLPPS